MIYLKNFETTVQYGTYIGGEPVLPNVSICDDNPVKVFYNPLEPEPEVEFVDLGLPSGKKWSNHLLGMSGDTDVENVLYFAWGDTVGVHDDVGAAPNDWAHAPFNNGSSSFNSSYWNEHKDEFIDSGTTLKLDYDAAHVKLGGNWRMPTTEELWELKNSTNVSDATIGDVSGIFLVSKSDETKKLFIPFVGNRYDTEVKYVSSTSIWSSTFDESWGGEAAMGIEFSTRSITPSYRYYGYCMLGIRE